VEYMYPITFQSIHAGTVYGEERIITKKSGVYGWHGDNSLQVVYLYDARGVLIPNDFVSTVDKNGVRTEVVLKKDQSAAIVKTPVTLENDNPVNFFVSQYDEKEIRISLNGKGMASFQVSNGKFPVTSHDLYGVCLVNVWSSTTMSDVDTFRFGATLDQVREIILWKRKQ
ncbi:MAG TPA: hypothetical protein PLZ55_19565, partial [bacterium]|nr:hypothetical protein [bacterium]